MVDICPTVTADTAEDYQRQIEQAAQLSPRLHIDFSDGHFAPRALLPLTDAWWPGGVRADLHLMFSQPLTVIDAVISIAPQLVIVPAEASGNFLQLSNRLRAHGIQVGVALLPQTSADIIRPALDYIDHVLIFSGNLGYQGGSRANLELLDKVRALRVWKANLEIGWDGGVADTNISVLARGGVDVINVGGYIQRAANKQIAYNKLKQLTL